MKGSILRLLADDLCRALEEIDPFELLLAQLVNRRGAGAGDEPEPAGRLLPAHGLAACPGAPTAMVVLEDLRSGIRCLLPRPGLYLVRDAVLGALAAGELLTPGLATVALLASGQAAQVHLVMIARHMSGIAHVALSPATDRLAGPVDARVSGLFDRAGISLSVVADAADAVLGANLLIVAGPGRCQLSLGRLARGALLVNATGQDLPDDLVDGVDGVYVDDIRLLEHNLHRHVVRLHMDARSHTRPTTRPHTEGWHRPGATWRIQRRIQADLGQVLSGEDPGRTHLDDILLVELLGTPWLDIALAYRLQQAAVEHNLGVWLPE